MTNGSNGYVLTIDTKARTWTSPSTGQVFKLKPISSALVNKLKSDQRGKPAMPTIRVNYGTTTQPEWGFEPNPDDLIYKEAYESWQLNNNNRMMMYVYSSGIEIDVPQEFIDSISEFDDTQSVSELKYFYLTAIIPSAEWGDLTNVILGQTVPTEAGIADATAGFPSNS